MKRYLFAAVCALIASATAAFGQMSTKDYDFSDFCVINASGDFQVTLVKGTTYGVQLIVTEGYLPYLTVNKEGATLVIGLDEKSLPNELKKSLFSKNKAEFKAVVTVPESAIDAVNLSGKASLTSNDSFSSGTFIASLTDASSISKLYMNCDKAEIRMDKKSEASIAIECKDLSVIQSATSNLSITHKSKNATFDLAAASNLTMDGKSEFFSLTSKGSAKSEMKGESKEATFKCSGSTNLSAQEFVCENLVVDLTGFCNIKSNAKETLAITMSGGANFSFSGDPAVDIKSIKNSTVTRLQ